MLDARTRQIWRTSPDEALALLRSTLHQLVDRNEFATKTIDIEPFGKFEPWDMLTVQRHLYNCEVALGHYEEALAVAALLPKREETTLQQVDCLMALGRRAEAIGLLERNLDGDSWRGTLRRRLTELGGNPLRSVD